MSGAGTGGRAFEFRADDGEPLHGVLFEPAEPASHVLGPVLVSGGLGIAPRFYAPFAAWLAAPGHRVMIFDLRGMGASRRPEHRKSLRGLHADMLTWARQDFAAAVKCLAGSAGGPPIALVGHSLGMHHAAMTDAARQARIDVAVSVAAGSGYWRDWAPASRHQAPLMLHLAAPLITPVLGYFPGRALRMVGDLPRAGDAAGVAVVPAPGVRLRCRAGSGAAEPAVGLLPHREAFSFTDDDATTEACTRQLLQTMPNAPSTLHVLPPGAVGLRGIGHVGAFRRAAAPALWPLFEASWHRQR